MYAFGHLTLTIYILYRLTKDLKKTTILAPLTLLPDLDLFLPIQHREILHSISIIPLLITSVLILNKILRLGLNNKDLLIISLLLYFLHIFADIICGSVMIFPGIVIGTRCTLDAVKDALFGFIFYVLLLFEMIKKS